MGDSPNGALIVIGYKQLKEGALELSNDAQRVAEKLSSQLKSRFGLDKADYGIKFKEGDLAKIERLDRLMDEIKSEQRKNPRSFAKIARRYQKELYGVLKKIGQPADREIIFQAVQKSCRFGPTNRLVNFVSVRTQRAVKSNLAARLSPQSPSRIGFS